MFSLFTSVAVEQEVLESIATTLKYGLATVFVSGVVVSILM